MKILGAVTKIIPSRCSVSFGELIPITVEEAEIIGKSVTILWL